MGMDFVNTDYDEFVPTVPKYLGPIIKECLLKILPNPEEHFESACQKISKCENYELENNKQNLNYLLHRKIKYGKSLTIGSRGRPKKQKRKPRKGTEEYKRLREEYLARRRERPGYDTNDSITTSSEESPEYDSPDELDESEKNNTKKNKKIRLDKIFNEIINNAEEIYSIKNKNNNYETDSLEHKLTTDKIIKLSNELCSNFLIDFNILPLLFKTSVEEDKWKN